jgi:hypothetical protein
VDLIMSENVTVQIGEFGVTNFNIRTNGLYTCRFFLINGRLDGVPFAYLDHYQYAISTDKPSSRHLIMLLEGIIRNLQEFVGNLSSKEGMLRFSDLQLMVGGGTIDNEEDVERNAFSLLIQPSPELSNHLTSMMTGENCLYLFNQLVNRTVIITPVLFKTSDDYEDAVYRGKLFSKYIFYIKREF